MAVKTKNAPAVEQHVSDNALGQRLLVGKLRAAMGDHEPLSDAKAKLRSIEEKRAILQSELDQAQSAVQNPDLAEMAETVLDGGELTGVDIVVQRRDSLRQKIQAHDLAIQQQRAVIANAIKSASAGACNIAAPIHRKAVDRLLDAFSEIQGATEELAMVQNSLAQNEVTTDNRFAFFHLAELQQLSRRLNHMIVSDWNPWLERMAE